MQPIGLVQAPAGGQRVAARRTLAALIVAAVLCAALGAGIATWDSSVLGGGQPLASGAAQGESATTGSVSTLPNVRVRTARISDELGAGDEALWPRARDGALVASGGSLAARFSAAGATFGSAGEQAGLAFTGLAGAAPAPSAVAPRALGDAVEYLYPDVRESYRYGPAGVEQSFLISRPPAGRTGQLALDMRASGSLTPREDRGGIVFSQPGSAAAMRYSGVSAVDSAGKRLPARVEVGGGGTTLRLIVDARGAEYPIAVDPFVETEQLTLQNVNGPSKAGAAISMSEDGNIALVGAPAADGYDGEVLVYTRSGSKWSQTATLTSPNGAPEGDFGYSVSISANGDTALVGAPYEVEDPNEAANGEKQKGAVWTFTRSGSTWEPSGSELRPAELAGPAHFGWSVALSGDGQVAVVGAPFDNVGEAVEQGAAWVYTRSGTAWIQAGEFLSEVGKRIEAEFGESVAASSNGEVILIGQPTGDEAWAYTRSGAQWGDATKVIAEAVGENELAEFGRSLALSANGNYALIGAPHYKLTHGAAFAFKRENGAWVQRGAPLEAIKEEEFHLGGVEAPLHGTVGWSVGLSANGETALISAVGYKIYQGAAWIYRWNGSNFEREQSEKHPLSGKHETVEGEFGACVALAGNGKYGLVGAIQQNKEQGGVWAFAEVKGTGKSTGGAPPSRKHKTAANGKGAKGHNASAQALPSSDRMS